MKEFQGLFCIWSDGDACNGDVALAMTDAIGLPFGELVDIMEQVEMDPEELGIKKGDNWITCGGFDKPKEEDRTGFWWLEKVSKNKAYRRSREILKTETTRYLSGAPFEGYEFEGESR